jgi:hypothetical protein
MKTIEHTSVDSDLYAFPKSQAPSFTNWASKRVLLTGSNGFLTASVDEVTDGLVWLIFKGATAPASWDAWVAKVDFSIEQIPKYGDTQRWTSPANTLDVSISKV